MHTEISSTFVLERTGLFKRLEFAILAVSTTMWVHVTRSCKSSDVAIPIAISMYRWSVFAEGTRYVLVP